MNDRIKILRQQSLDAINCISAERAMLVTGFYNNPGVSGMPVPLQRAECFMHIMKNKKICINPGELIVGERGPAPKATPTYPEICLHTLKDLDILDKREKVSFVVDETVREAFRETIIPFWTGKTNRERIFSAMDREWIRAYQAGIFTEFQEQRAPGHTVAGGKVFQKGMNDYIRECEDEIKKLSLLNEPEITRKRQQLEAMVISAKAIILFAERHAAFLEEMATSGTDLQRKKELSMMADICRKVPAEAPETFHEALQHYWFLHLGVITELNPWDSFSPGRLDRHLYPFYKKDIEAERLTPAMAKELLQAFWIKFNNHPAPPKVGVTAKESNTYTDFTLINLGGLTAEGEDAVNDLTYLVLDVIEVMRLLQPGTMIQVSRKNPDRFIERALKIIETGFGQPSVFNTDAIISELLWQGKAIEDARNGGCSGCVETGAFGTESYTLTGYFNLPKILEITLNNGLDPATGLLTGIETGDPLSFNSIDDIISAFRNQLEYFAGIKIRGNNRIEKIYAGHLPVPFLSLLIDDCICKGTDY
ncbi:MAG: pyruvate formate lyase family protein, partial [Bacteroidota bacterium]